MQIFIKIMLIFFCYGFIGWSLEVCYAYYVHKKLINRGFLNSPICPMYGVGMVLLVTLLTPLKFNPIFVFLGAAIITSALEWVTGWLLELIFHTKWWDYSDKKFNLNGYICLSFSIIWGVAALPIIYFLQPLIDKLILKIPDFLEYWIVGVLSVFLIVDIAISVISALHLKERMHQMSFIIKDFVHDLELANWNEIKEKLSAHEHWGIEQTANYEDLLHRKNIVHNRLLKAYPRATAKNYNFALHHIRDNTNKRGK